MKLYSTRNKNHVVDFKHAVFNSLPPDNGLYMPTELPQLPPHFFETISKLSLTEIAFEVANYLLKDSIPPIDLKQLIDKAIDFDAPLKKIEANTYVLELFHGPSMAFKDFGARFMSGVMSYFLQKENSTIDILVATSGDTGGAVALGFLNAPHIRVTILYPKNRVSALQQQQLTIDAPNIRTIEIDGSFDDCQQLVKEAFLDGELSKKFNLSSANSINICRLIPQMFYYFNAYAQLKREGAITDKLFIAVPSGNFGNLAAGIMAMKMGLPVTKFIAATNSNHVVPSYIHNGVFTPAPSKPTLSNAMDVGNPSNFSRILELFNDQHHAVKAAVAGYHFTDQETIAAISKIHEEAAYVMCPHTAVAYLGLEKYVNETNPGTYSGIFLSTAHACKFNNAYTEKVAASITVPVKAQQLLREVKQPVSLSNKFKSFKEFLLQQT